MKALLFASIFFHSLSLSAQSNNPFLPGALNKTAIIPTHTNQEKTTATPTVSVNVFAGNVITPVSPYIYGNNANPYMTQMVDQPALLGYIKDLSPNVIRFPGGNLSSVFFWDGEKDTPPADAPATLRNADGVEGNPGYWYGTNSESWTLSVDNYYQMLAETGNTGMITVNYGYARYSTADDPVASAAHHAAEWVRYDNGKTKFWEIGNESNGNWQAGFRINTANNKDGQPEIITGALYGKHFKVFADSMRKAADEIGAEIFIGAQLLAEEPASWWNNTDRFWNQGVFDETGNLPDYYIIHSYYTPYNANSNAADILNSAAPVTRSMMEYVTESVADAGLTQKPIALTEWNIFAVGSKQQISYINGMHAVMVLGELAKNKYGMASRWNLANNYDQGNDHGTFSQGNEPNIPQWNPRPSFHYMYFFQRYFGDHMVESEVTGNSNILAYASTFSSGEYGVVLVNKGNSGAIVDLNIVNSGVGERYYHHTLTGGTDNGEFSLKVSINGVGPTLSAGGPASYKTIPARSSTIPGGILVTAPARSVVYVLVDHGDNLITNIAEEIASGIKLVPNPSSGHLTIFFPYTGFSAMEIMDMRGRKVLVSEIDSSAESIQMQTAIPRGMYLVRFTRFGKLFVKKLMVE